MELHHSWKNYSSQEQKVLETFNTRLSSHSLHQGSYKTKWTYEEATTSEKLCSFNKEEFERLFGVDGVLDDISLGESICVLFVSWQNSRKRMMALTSPSALVKVSLAFLVCCGHPQKGHAWAVWRPADSGQHPWLYIFWVPCCKCDIGRQHSPLPDWCHWVVFTWEHRVLHQVLWVLKARLSLSGHQGPW